MFWSAQRHTHTHWHFRPYRRFLRNLRFRLLLSAFSGTFKAFPSSAQDSDDESNHISFKTLQRKTELAYVSSACGLSTRFTQQHLRAVGRRPWTRRHIECQVPNVLAALQVISCHDHLEEFVRQGVLNTRNKKVLRKQAASSAANVSLAKLYRDTRLAIPLLQYTVSLRCWVSSVFKFASTLDSSSTFSLASRRRAHVPQGVAVRTGRLSKGNFPCSWLTTCNDMLTFGRLRRGGTACMVLMGVP